MRLRRVALPLATLCLAAIGAPNASAASLSTLPTGLKDPTAIAFRPGNPNPVIAQRNGVIATIVRGKVRKLADLSDRVGQQGAERGLLGLAYSPSYRDDGLVFVYFTDIAGDAQVVRFRRGRYDHLLKGSATTLFSIRQPYANHNGGPLAFGPDGFLYIGTGDGGAGGDPGNRAQNPSTLLGKILRVDVKGGDPYAIPSSNPFAAGGGDPAVWAMGVRMPHFSFDSRTGCLWLVDAGQSGVQEVDWVPNPAPALPNFGWSAFDGTGRYKPQPTPGTLVTPLTSYGRAYGCFAVAGVLYRGKALKRDLRSTYVFGDACSGRIWSVKRTDPKLVDTGLRVPRLAAIGQDDAGALWLIDAKGRLSTVTP